MLSAVDVVLIAQDADMGQYESARLPRGPSSPYQTLMLGRGTEGSLTVPENRLSR
jgi:hypothetical protein